ncbi:MAG: hypothetical protein CMB76_09080 [Euryarchaeota archaeon]|nr:hypothetical protein [Euryarchaeota archaeon]|tara:strand:+ start:257 stop:2353 length:2097 start_codon:yes stop_codon:yes gene_type:complete
MAAIPSQLTSLDFFEIKESIRSYLRTRKEFTDYDFEGSSASYLIDILAYNTYYTAFNANMALNEAFLETATVRDNIVRLAKQLNYTPRSIKAPRACVKLLAQTSVGLSGTSYPEFATLRKGDVFVADNDFDSYTFALTQDIQVPVDSGTGLATFDNVLVYQGNLLTYNYTVDYTKRQDFIIPDEKVDTGLLTVDISPTEQSSETDTYSPATNVTNADGTSRIYYLEETDDMRYRLVFGDGSIGRKLIDGEYITISYVSTDGVEANGARGFNFIGNVVDSDLRVVSPNAISLTTKDAAQDGEDRETSLSVKFRAPRAYATQNRAVTENDFEHIVSEIYPQAASVTAFGGEKLNPPIYGKVYVAIRPKTGTKLNATTKQKIKKDLLKYSIASIEPVIIDPTIFYVLPKSYVYYNGNDTALTGAQLGTKILQGIDAFNKNGATNRFGNRIDGSKFGAMIDNADNAISGNVTQMTLGQNLDKFAFGQVFTQCLDFGNPLYDPSGYSGTPDDDDNGTGGKCKPSFSVVKSGTFYATGYTEDLVNLTLSDGSTSAQVSTPGISTSTTNQVLVPVNIRDDGRGNLILVTVRDETELTLNPSVGSVNYGTGQVCVGPVAIQGTPDGTTRLPIQVLPAGGSISVPPGVDPTIFNPQVNPIDYTINDVSIPTFDPNNFNGYNYGDTSGINIIDYPSDTFEYPVSESCF